MQRRSVLAGGAASFATLTLGGCPRAAPAIERRFVGPSPERGHLVRDARGRAAPPTDKRRCEVLIVGGGASGAAAAWRLLRAGVRDVLLIELEGVPGGTSAGGSMTRGAYPLGAHYLPAPHPELTALRTLLTDLGVVLGHDAEGVPDFDPRAIARAPVERHRFGGRWYEGLYPAAGQTLEEEAQWERWRSHLRELDAARGPDGRRLFALPVERSSTALRHLDAISMDTYLRSLGFSSWRLRWVVDYACRDDYGCRTEEVSAFAGLHHFLARGLEDEEARPLLTWPQGNAYLVDGMFAHADLGERRLLDTAAISIDPDRGRTVVLDFATQRTATIDARVILWAAPRFLLGFVLPQSRDPLPRGALEYTPWLTATVGLDIVPQGFGAPLAWDNVPVHADHLGYVVATHQAPLTEVRPGSVVTYYEPLLGDPTPARKRLLEGSLQHWSEHVEHALAAMHPQALQGQIREVHLTRFGHAMIRPVPGLLFGPHLALAAAPIGNVIPCAADVSGLPLFEEAFYGGVRAAETAMARLGLAFEPLGHA